MSAATEAIGPWEPDTEVAFGVSQRLAGRELRAWVWRIGARYRWTATGPGDSWEQFGRADTLAEAQAAAEEVLGERGPWRTIAWRRTAGAWTAAVVAQGRLEAPEPRAAWSWRVWHAALHDDGWREGGPCGEAPTAAEARACAEVALRAAGGGE